MQCAAVRKWRSDSTEPVQRAVGGVPPTPSKSKPIIPMLGCRSRSGTPSSMAGAAGTRTRNRATASGATSLMRASCVGSRDASRRGYTGRIRWWPWRSAATAGRTSTKRSCAPTGRSRSAPRISSCSRRPPTCSAARPTTSARSSAPTSAHLDAGEAAARRCAARSGSASTSPARRDRSAPAAGSAARQRLLERERRRLRRAGLPAAPGDLRAGGERRPRGGRRDRRRGGGDRRALRRPGPVRARGARAGPHPDQARARSRRASRCWTRRWSPSPPASCRRSSPASSTAA